MPRKLKIEQQKRKEHWRLFKYDDDVIKNDLMNGTHIEIFGNGNISIDGCLGVFEYKDTYLKLKLSHGALILCGSGFDIVYYENRLITVKGKISSVEFCV